MMTRVVPGLPSVVFFPVLHEPSLDGGAPVVFMRAFQQKSLVHKQQMLADIGGILFAHSFRLREHVIDELDGIGRLE